MSGEIGKASSGLTPNFPPYSAAIDKLPQTKNLPYQGDKCCTCLTLSSGFQSPASHHILLWEPGASHPLGTTKLASHTPWLFTPFQSANLM